MAAHTSSDPHQFGRVDDDGTVWLVTAAGERNIGSWQAGDPEAAFAYYGRRFEDLSTEITLMEERLTSGTGDARKIKANAIALAETLPTACVLGDVDALGERLTNLVARIEVLCLFLRAPFDGGGGVTRANSIGRDSGAIRLEDDHAVRLVVGLVRQIVAAFLVRVRRLLDVTGIRRRHIRFR